MWLGVVASGASEPEGGVWNGVCVVSASGPKEMWALKGLESCLIYLQSFVGI